MHLPMFPEGLTAAWLTQVLREKGLLSDRNGVSEVIREQVGDGTGMMSELCRVRLNYAEGIDSLPSSFIAKYPSQNPTNREMAMSYNLYEREVRYFAELDPLIDEGQAYADRLEAAGVAVTCRRVPGAIHAFLGFIYTFDVLG